MEESRPETPKTMADAEALIAKLFDQKSALQSKCKQQSEAIEKLLIVQGMSNNPS